LLCENVAYFARARPAAVACVDMPGADTADGRRLTYAGLEDRAARMAAALVDLAGPGDLRSARIAVLARNSSDVVCLFLACRKLGAIFVPLNWRLSGAELAALASIAAPRLLLVHPEFSGVAVDLHRAMPDSRLLDFGEASAFDAAAARAASRAAVTRPARDRDVITILFTSGTTGRPKGVIVTEANARASAANYALSVGLGPASVFLCDMPMFHVVGLFTVTSAVLQSGGTLLISPQFSAEQTQARIADASLGITHYFCVPQMTQMLRSSPAFDPVPFRRLAAFQTGGAPHAEPSVRSWLEDGVRCVDGFGMTEAGTVLGMPPHDLELLRAKAGSVGVPAAYMNVRIVGQDGRDVRPGEVGELWLRGPSVTPGYWKDSRATRAAFTNGWLRSGDASRADEDGFHVMVDRWKDMYISGGENVYPAEIEGVLLQFDAVREAAVVGVPDTRWGEVGVAFLVMANDAPFVPDAVLAFCRSRLAGYKLPKELHVVDELPRTASGKVKKDLLRSMRFGGHSAIRQGGVTTSSFGPSR